ncbi:hypothetical protein ACFXON_24305, partial [Bacillus subtilis]
DAQVWKLGIHVVVADVDDDKREFVSRRMARVIKELRTLDHITNVAARHSGENLMAITIDVAAEDALLATQIGISALRTAVHTVGGDTPGWEEVIHQLVRNVQFGIESPGKTDDMTPCAT